MGNFGWEKNGNPEEYSMNNEQLKKVWHDLTSIENDINTVRSNIETSFETRTRLKEKEYLLKCPCCGGSIVLSVDENKINIIIYVNKEGEK